MSVEQQINTTDIHKFTNPLSGDCASVAAALVEVFNGKFVCLYADMNHTNEYLPAHVVVEINGELYDGTGKITKRELFEIHVLMNGCGNKTDNIEEYFSYESPPEYMIDTNKKEKVKQQFN